MTHPVHTPHFYEPMNDAVKPGVSATCRVCGANEVAECHRKDVRYPYTYAADLLRMVVEPGPEGVQFSRADSSAVRQVIAKALGMEDRELAMKLADYFMAHETELGAAAAKKLLQVGEEDRKKRDAVTSGFMFTLQNPPKV